MTKPKTIVAYHFLRDDYRSGEGNEPAWAVGESRSLVGGTITPCQRGYHGSPTLFDALMYAPGSIACMVELTGSIKKHGAPTDKYAARSRKLIAAVDLTYELRMFAADCAEHVLPIFEKDYQTDMRPREAIAAARAFARGEIGAAARDAARAAAWDAALAAAGAAARDAARAAAWDAARDAARAAAWDAAGAAAWDAAGAAARYAAGAAAGAAARAAEREWQRTTFDSFAAHIFDGAVQDA